MTDEQFVEIFTDGACSGNPGPGGWGVILRYGRHEREMHGGESWTTNNRMELMAAIQALEALTRSTQVTVYTDSVYLRDGITKWVDTWQQNGWRTASKKPVKNVDLWQILDDLASQHTIEWRWVKGHSGVAENELVDQMACAQIDKGLAAINK